MGQITVFSGPERRRHWTDEQRLRIVTEAFTPGVCVSAVARRHDVSTGQLYTWRNRLLVSTPSPADDREVGPGFAQAVVIKEQSPSSAGSDAAIVVDLPHGRRVTISSGASPVMASAVLKALR